jgi:hypothetical protein
MVKDLVHSILAIIRALFFEKNYIPLEKVKETPLIHRLNIIRALRPHTYQPSWL